MELPHGNVLIVQAVGFIVLVLIFWRFLFKPIRDVLDARRGEVAGQFENAEAEQKKAEEYRADYERRLAAVEDEIRGRITEAIKEGQAARDEILADSRAKAESILTRAQDEIQREKEKAMVELKTAAATLAIEAAGKLIQENLDSPKQRKLVSSFIDGLSEVKK